MAKYRLSQVAKEDLIRIYQYGVEQYGMSQADRYFNLLLEYFERIAKNPYAFESVGYIRKGYRRCVCGSDSIYYKIEDGRVDIMTIIGRQDIEGV